MTSHEIALELNREDEPWDIRLGFILRALGFGVDELPAHALYLRNIALTPLQAVRFLILLGQERMDQADDVPLTHMLYVIAKARTGGVVDDDLPF